MNVLFIEIYLSAWFEYGIYSNVVIRSNDNFMFGRCHRMTGIQIILCACPSNLVDFGLFVFLWPNMATRMIKIILCTCLVLGKTRSWVTLLNTWACVFKELITVEPLLKDTSEIRTPWLTRTLD